MRGTIVVKLRADLCHDVLRGKLLTSKAEAQALVDQVKQGIDLIIPAVIELWQRRSWVPLGYLSWQDLCAAEFSALLHFRLPRPERVEAVRQITAAGMSDRAQAIPLGADPKTVASDRKRAGVEIPHLRSGPVWTASNTPLRPHPSHRATHPRP
jgi:hypothetical protein